MLRKTLFSIFAFFMVFAVQVGAVSMEDTKEIEQEMIRDGNYEEALEELTAMLKDHPGEACVYMDLGIAYYGLMEYQKAYEHLKRSVEIGPKKEFSKILSYAISKIEENRETLQQMEELKNRLEGEGEIDRAGIKEMIALGHFSVLMELLKERFYYPAIATAHVIWLKNNASHYPDIYKISGDIYYSAMLYDKAEEDYKKAIERDPENSRLHKTLADCLVAKGDLDSAQEYYDKSISLYKKEGIKEDDAIIVELKKIRQALPKKYKDIGELIEKKRYDEAEAICKKKMSLNPGDYVAITQLGEIYWNRDKRGAAMKLFKKVVKFAPDYPPAHLLLGRAYFYQHKHDEAIKEFNIFEKKMDLLPEMDEDTIDYYVASLNNITYLYSSLKRYDLMAKECKKIIKIKPDDQIAHYNLAICYYNHFHNPSAAYNELQKVIEIDYATRIADSAKFLIDYIRRNPDARFIGDYSFIFEY